MKNSSKRKYRAIFANDGHEPIRTWEEFLVAGGYNASLGLFLDGKLIGYGQLFKLYKKGLKAVHTCSVYLHEEYRNQGHGLPLYFELIRAAKKIGADRIYSDHRLNRYSRRMWSQKLPQHFQVVAPKGKPRCSKCRHCQRSSRFYINL